MNTFNLMMDQLRSICKESFNNQYALPIQELVNVPSHSPHSQHEHRVEEFPYTAGLFHPFHPETKAVSGVGSHHRPAGLHDGPLPLVQLGSLILKISTRGMDAGTFDFRQKMGWYCWMATRNPARKPPFGCIKPCE